jgi:hypothetical protein
MNPEKELRMNQPQTKTESQEESNLEEPTSRSAPKPWIVPTFERFPLNEALDNPGAGSDFNGRAS